MSQPKQITESFYQKLKEDYQFNEEMEDTITNTLDQLMNTKTTQDHPGMLLGHIQSGKTRTFIGVTALGFDRGIDITIVLTKPTRVLAMQTYQRLVREFSNFHKEDRVQIFDIMHLPEQLTKYERNQKLIIVAKKQKDNLQRLLDFLGEDYPELLSKQTLLIDDEADYASIGFSKTKKETLEINTIAGQIDSLRTLMDDVKFLQVTATPYSLYLQPETLAVPSSSKVFEPIKPAFTSLVPVPETYVGGHFYFEQSRVNGSLASYVFTGIPMSELEALQKPDRRRIKLEEAINGTRTRVLTQALIRFITGAAIRSRQSWQAHQRRAKYSFIIHTKKDKQAHEWQYQVVRAIIDQLTKAAQEDSVLFHQFVSEAYENLLPSLKMIAKELPTLETVKTDVRMALYEEYVMCSKVNSEQDINSMMDENGELRLRTPMNIFIGGQILDRGVTITNLIGFYYGRNPRTFQQDTVLQHSRMYGYRAIEDMAVTRFYTNPEIYEVMDRIHQFDTTLREAFEKEKRRKGLVFMEKDETNTIVPCSPNKLTLSKVITIEPHKRLTPYGFQTKYKTHIAKLLADLDRKLTPIEQENPVSISSVEAIQMLKQIKETFDERTGRVWNERTMMSIIEYFTGQDGDLLCLIRSGRNMSRVRANGRFEDAPDTPSGMGGELKVARRWAIEKPVLIMLRQEGLEERGWRGTPFWWPVLVTPKNTEAAIFSEG